MGQYHACKRIARAKFKWNKDIC
jgi:hypothetical protein